MILLFQACERPLDGGDIFAMVVCGIAVVWCIGLMLWGNRDADGRGGRGRAFLLYWDRQSKSRFPVPFGPGFRGRYRTQINWKFIQ